MSLTESELKIVEDACVRLSEHFDSVRIFVTKHSGSDDKTLSYETGAGNFFAQYGQVREWLVIIEQHQKNYAKEKDDDKP